MANAGALDRRVSLWRNNAKAADGFNEGAADWVEMTPPGGVSASYAPLSDGEAVRAEQVQAAITDRFQIRWSRALDGIEPLTWRLTFEGRTYDIARKKNLGRRGRELIEISGKAQAITPAIS